MIKGTPLYADTRGLHLQGVVSVVATGYSAIQLQSSKGNVPP